MNKGDIVLANFPFTDLLSTKKRPALVLAADTEDVTLAFITSKTHRLQPSDVLIKPNSSNGLKVDSAIRVSKLATVKQTLVEYKLGSLSSHEISAIDDALISVFSIKLPV